MRVLVLGGPHHVGRAVMGTALGDGAWDVVVDTWSGAPRVVREAAALLAVRADRYCYVTSRSVVQWPVPPGADESAPVVEADPCSHAQQARPGHDGQPARGREGRLRLVGPAGLGVSGDHRGPRHRALDRAAGLDTAGDPPSPPGPPACGLDPRREREVLAAVAG